MNLADAILAAMIKLAPPGQSGWSVEPVPVEQCARDSEVCGCLKLLGDPLCEVPRKSTWWGGWVVQETRATAEARYTRAASFLAEQVDAGLAQDEKHVWGPTGDVARATFAGMAVAAAFNESDFREDVAHGRVEPVNKKTGAPTPGYALGAGRGPGGEVCYMQILPSMARKFGGPDALLGDADIPLALCFHAGLEQLWQARAWCDRWARVEVAHYPQARPPNWIYRTFSMYGVGNSCVSANHGKTQARVKTAERVIPMILRALREHEKAPS